jgi:hypothetical protein
VQNAMARVILAMKTLFFLSTKKLRVFPPLSVQNKHIFFPVISKLKQKEYLLRGHFVRID